MVSFVSTPQCGQRIVASVTGFAMGGIYCRFGDWGPRATADHDALTRSRHLGLDSVSCR